MKKLLQESGVLLVMLVWVVGLAPLMAINLLLPDTHRITYFNKSGHQPWYRDGDVHALILGSSTIAAASFALSVALNHWIVLVAVPGSIVVSALLLLWCMRR